MEVMKAAVLTAPATMTIKEVPIPRVRPQTILIKVKVCAVCGSDIRIFRFGNKRVKYPAIIGHELSGEVVGVGSEVNTFKVGDRVSVGADVPCGECFWCQNDMGNLCNDNYAIGYQFQGGFAQYCLLEPMVIKYGSIRHVPNGVSFEDAALAEPLACCINGLERVFFSSEKTVLIIGAGPMGILLMLTVRSYGASRVILVEQDTKRLEKARDFSADYIIDSKKEDIKKRIMAITSGKGADYIFTACPSVEAQEEAMELVTKGGFINFFGGLPDGSRPISFLSNSLHYKEAYVTGSHGSTPRQYAMALDMIASGRIEVSKLITHRFPLEEILQAFNVISQKDCLKVLILPNQE